MFGVYVHIPWCRIRCPYCAFAVSTRKDPPHAAYTDAVLREWDLRRPLFSGRPSSVFFGGGTPSLCPPDELARVLAALDPSPGAEVSMEANPGDLPVPLSAFRDAGITRLSLGVQSFDPAVARRLGRGHTSDDARALVAEAKATGFASVSFDLIFAVPGQSLRAFEADLAAVVALAPDHVALYGLTIEPESAFARARTPAVHEDLWRAMYDAAVGTLSAAGIDRYEVSNFARPGHRSRHNEHYWRARPWAGLGASAHAWWPDGRRASNVADVDRYLTAADPLELCERPAARALAYELLWSTLRHVDGVDRAALTARTGLDVRVDPALVRAGLMVEHDGYMRLTTQGFPLADGIAGRLADSLVDADPAPPLPVRHGVSVTLNHPARTEMTKSTPPGPTLAPGDLLIEIDPSLIDEALAAVERGARHAAEARDATEPADAFFHEEVVLEVALWPELDPAPSPPSLAAPARPDDERRRLQFRLHEQQETIRRLERDLGRAVESRDAFDRQARDVRKAHSELAADFDRLRARARKDLEEAERRGEDRVLRPVVDVFDNVERAWRHAMSDPAQLLGGLQMIVEQFKRLLVRLGFERVEAERGTLFDPTLHEAVLHVHDDDVLPGAIIDEVHAGFRLRGRLFRPSRVTVSAPND